MASKAANGNSLESDLGSEVFNALVSESSVAGGNVIISPLLLEAVLSLLYLGSDGKTAEELKNKLQLKRFGSNARMASYFAAHLEIATQQTDTKLQLCTKILLNPHYEIDVEFEKIAQKYFHVATESYDFQQTDETWPAEVAKLWEQASNKTTNTTTTPRTCAPPARTAAAVVAAAVNFENKWFLPFSAYRTGLYDFHNSPTSVKSIPMMLDEEMFVKFAELPELDARAVELPYEHDDDLAMLLVLPNRRDGLADLEEKLRGADLNALADRMQMESVQLLLPKFKIDFECSLRDSLEKLGVATIFSREANFRNMISANPQDAFAISDVFHKVLLEVNESGSQASNIVANKPIVVSNSLDTRQKFFRADHPFYFAIRNRSVTYFVGHVAAF